MRKPILIAAVISCSFTALAQNTHAGIADPVPPPPREAPVSATDMVLTSVEQMPEFPGGMAAMMQFLNSNVKYPEAARTANIQGKVILKFVVSKTGKVEHVEVMRDIGGGCGDEALRVVRAMPNWKPGRQNGQLVNVYYTLPISFRLSEPQPEKRAR